MRAGEWGEGTSTCASTVGGWCQEGRASCSEAMGTTRGAVSLLALGTRAMEGMTSNAFVTRPADTSICAPATHPGRPPRRSPPPRGSPAAGRH